MKNKLCKLNIKLMKNSKLNNFDWNQFHVGVDGPMQWCDSEEEKQTRTNARPELGPGCHWW